MIGGGDPVAESVHTLNEGQPLSGWPHILPQVIDNNKPRDSVLLGVS